MKRAVVATLAKVDEALDEVLYRPAVVKAFAWVPRWWLCDLAKLSVALDDRWATDYWGNDATVPGGPCEACSRRAAIHVYESVDGRPSVSVCGWCHLTGQILTDEDLRRELEAARADSVAWRWRWRVRS
jgi:hypothetical protein